MKDKKAKPSRHSQQVTEAIAKRLVEENAKDGVDLSKLTKDLAKRRLENMKDEQNEE